MVLGLGHLVFQRTLRAQDAAVQLHHVPAAGPRVQTVHVLGHEGEVWDPALECRQRLMSPVRCGCCNEIAPLLVPLPYQVGISGERLRGRELLRIVARPEPCLSLAEGGYPALGRDAGACQRDDAWGGAEELDEIRR